MNAEEGAAWQWNGCLFQQTNVSLILVEVPPCRGPRLQITDAKVRAGADSECAYWIHLPKSS